jgi:hypothetical protein
MGAFYADEISTGLDSSTTYEICRSLRTAAHLLDSVLVVALLQARACRGWRGVEGGG